MDFPRYVFKSPGANDIREGSYDTELVKDQEGFDKLVKAGWNETILGAVDALKNPKADEPEEEAGPADLTKAEIVAKLTELKVDFDKALKKADLLPLLIKALAEEEE